MSVGFTHFVASDPQAVALISPDGHAWSRGRLNALANRVVRMLDSFEVEPGNTIALLLPNCAEYAAIYLAGIRAGVGIVPINWHLSRPEIRHILEDCRAKVIFIHHGLGQTLIQATAEDKPTTAHTVSFGNHSQDDSLENILASAPPENIAQRVSGRLMAYTSATTGRPKAVLLPSSNASQALDRIVVANKAIGIYPEDDNVHLCASMLYHSAPLGGVDIALQLGHKVVLTDIWTPELLLRLIDEHQVTTTFMVPAMFIRLLKLSDEVRQKYSTASIRFLVHGGAPCPPEIKQQILKWFGDVVWESYGSTEASGTIVSPADWRKFPGTVGRPIPGSAIKIFDAIGKELGPGEVGMIYIRPHTGDRFEYRGDPDKTVRAYIGDFITVGDLGYLNEAGYLFLCGRSGDLIISSGMNIYPAEIETVLVLHPAVSDCAVTPEPHELLGEVPKAYVQLEEGFSSGPRMTSELLRYLSARLSPMKLPKRVSYVSHIPRDPNGKLFKRLLIKDAAK